MMSIATVHAVWFSGTGTTEKTVRRIARRLADKLGSRYAEYSYTLPQSRQRSLTIPAGDLVRWPFLWCCSATVIMMIL